MEIGDAVQALKEGSVLTRAAWNTRAMLSLEEGVLTYSDSYGSVEYMADTEDLLATDWELL